MTAAGARIIKGLKDAVAGNFSAVTIEGQRWVRAPEWRLIESAPNDGRLVLVCGGKNTSGTIVRGADGDWWRRGKSEGLSSVPTHWMPLPDPEVQP